LLIEAGKIYEELRSVLVYAKAEIIDDAGTTQRVMKMVREKDARLGYPSAPLSPEQLDSTSCKAGGAAFHAGALCDVGSFQARRNLLSPSYAFEAPRG